MAFLNSLKFGHLETHINHKKANKFYGDKSMFFKTLEKAKDHLQNSNKKYITRMVDYNIKDVLITKDLNGKIIGTKIKEGAKTHTKGWLVN